MSDLNVVCLTGRLGRDPELTYTPSGKAVLNLDLAVAGSGGEGAEVHWVPLVCWGKTAENMATYLGKGSRVAVEGRLQVRKWQGEDGRPRSKMEVVAERVTFLESRPREGIGPGKAEDGEITVGEAAAAAGPGAAGLLHGTTGTGAGTVTEPGATKYPLYDDQLGRATGTFDPKVPF